MAAKPSLRQRREAKGLTQPQLADLLGVCVMTIYRAEKRNSMPKNRLVREALEKALA